MCMGYFADKILYCSCYNGEIISDIPNRLLIKYSKKTFGKWNKSIIKKNIKKIRILLSKKANYDSYIDINYIFHIILATYHDSYKLYVKTIIILNKFFSKYGYASFYKLWQNDFVDFEATKIDISEEFCIIIESEKIAKNKSRFNPFLSTYHKCNIDGKECLAKGFVPNLYYYNKELLIEFIRKIYNPARENYLKLNDFQKKNDISFMLNNKSSINDLKNVKMINMFLKMDNLNEYVK